MEKMINYFKIDSIMYCTVLKKYLALCCEDDYVSLKRKLMN